MFVVVSYDIVEDKKRNKLAKKMCGFGSRVQYSVFECIVNAAQYKRMKQEALKWIDPKTDSLRLYILCGECREKIESYGRKRGIEEDGAVVV